MALKDSKTTLTDVGVGGVDVEASRTSFMSQSSRQIARQQLAQAREILRLGLENVNYARTAVALNDGKSIADVSWIKVGVGWCWVLDHWWCELSPGQVQERCVGRG